MKFLLSVIALCLVMITAKLYIPEAQAEVLTGYETSLVLDAVAKRCRVEQKPIQQLISDGTDGDGYRPFYMIAISCL